MPATRKRKIHRGRVTKAPVRMRAMADAPPWMTAFEIEGALQPGTDCEEAYMAHSAGIGSRGFSSSGADGIGGCGGSGALYRILVSVSSNRLGFGSR